MKSEVKKLRINKWVNVPTILNNLKTKVDDLDLGKLRTIPADLKKLSNLVDNEVVKNTKFNTLKTEANNLRNKIFDAATLFHINQYNKDKQNGDGDKKMPDTSGLVTTTVLNAKFSEVQNKIPDHAKYITTQEFNNLIAENCALRLKQVNTDFDNKLNGLIRKITSNKTKYLEIQKKTK